MDVNRSQLPTLFVSGFGAFEGVTDNPSGALARILGQRPDVHGVELPVTFRGSAEALDVAVGAMEPSPVALLALGVHRGPGFRLESQAGAELTSTRPDNAGEVGSSLGLSGPVRHTSLDLDALERVLEVAGSGPVQRSDDAGGYVCQRVYWHVLGQARSLGVPALFLHIPPIEERPVPDQVPCALAVALEILRQVS
jgi:pyroglutamyl-peptidase